MEKVVVRVIAPCYAGTQYGEVDPGDVISLQGNDAQNLISGLKAERVLPEELRTVKIMTSDEVSVARSERKKKEKLAAAVAAGAALAGKDEKQQGNGSK